MKREGDHTYTLTLHVWNRPGVLVRCAQVFNRRSHNIESLHVTASGDEDISIMTITAFGKPAKMHQIVMQLQKIIDVKSVAEHQEA
ncbi:acetolactate synthase small subunit [Candidatus Saccharibacteria bacterium]|nr:MAG: acetolactate synthase small subunit [Candidatus Saccharibacteria bacterium]